jgi:tetratricopeptide (TPR) repeat protein
MIHKRSTDNQSDDDDGNDIAKGTVLDSVEIIRGTKMSEADHLSRGGDYPAAIPLYSQAISIRPSEVLYLRRSRCYAFVGELKAGLEDGKSAYALNPKSIKALICIADCFYSMGDFESALLWYSRGKLSL